MSKYLSSPTVFALILSVAAVANADPNKAPCGSFKKSPNGKWNVVNPVKIESDKDGAMLSPGTTIGPGTRIAGIDIYAALERSCH